ncbi:hypothetical protein [Bacillus sp. FSL P2-0092]|uniref:hypothetical protein n=1 Tax=Bacillus sp. FSL P2-0092 TaxID=2921571 RepID=UPI0030FBDE7A
MKLSYITFMKHAEKITKKASTGRPVLKGVFHSETGDLAVTDSHRLYTAKNIIRKSDEEIVDPTTGDLIEGKYPDLKRLIPDESSSTAQLLLDTDVLLTGLNALLKCNQVSKDERPFITLSADPENKSPKISSKNAFIEAQFTVGQFREYREISLSADTQYIIDAISLFKAAKVNRVVLRYFGNLHPFTITPENSSDLLALIMPIKRDEASQ